MTNFFNKYYIYIIFIIYFLVNIGLLNNYPFSIDHEYWLTKVRHIPNPLYSWLPWSPYYKSWPLTYTILWTYLKVFGESVVYLRFFNLIIHFLNFLVFHNIVKKMDGIKKYTRPLSLLFLFAPVSVLTISWGFQIKTLLAVLFLLLAVNKCYSKNAFKSRDHILIFLLFFLSLMSKVVAILFPIYYLFHFKKEIKSKTAFKVSFLSLAMTAIIVGLLNIKGVAYFVQEADIIKKELFEEHKEKPITHSDIKDQNITNEIKISTQSYIASISSLSKIRDKQIVAVQNFGRLLLESIGVFQYHPFYEENQETLKRNSIYIYTALGVLLLTFGIFRFNSQFILIVCLFIPISGYLYVPYMKYSFSSDHWFYPCVPFVLLFLASQLKNKYLWTTIMIAVSSNYLFTLYNYRSFSHALARGYIHEKNQISLEASMYYSYIYDDIKAIGKSSQYILDNKDQVNFEQFKNLTNAAMYFNRVEVSKRYIGRFLTNLIDSKSKLQLKSFIAENSNILTTREQILSYTLIYAHQSFIKSQDYLHAIHWLDKKDDPL